MFTVFISGLLRNMLAKYYVTHKATLFILYSYTAESGELPQTLMWNGNKRAVMTGKG